MDEKISLEAIALYGDAYAEKVLKGFFASKDNINGQEILSLCSVQQVNLFVIRELFKAWREDTRKLKSPYFDFENPQVREALDAFMNTASQHILINRAHFSPLLKKAVSQTLLVIFDPYDFYSMTMTGLNNKLEVAPFREEIKYLKINKAPLEKMLEKLENQGIKEIPGNEAFAILDQILEAVNFAPEELEPYIEKFSSVLPLDPTSFIVKKAPEPVYTPPTTVIPEEKVVVAEPVFAEPKPIEQPKSAQAANTPKVTGPTLSQSAPTVNDNMTASYRPTVVENFQKISRIKDSLTINQKFMFTKVLFHGDFELFSKAIDRLDQLDSMKAALRYLDDEYASTWDRDSEEFHEFMELVEKRFA